MLSGSTGLISFIELKQNRDIKLELYSPAEDLMKQNNLVSKDNVQVKLMTPQIVSEVGY